MPYFITDLIGSLLDPRLVDDTGLTGFEPR